MPKSKRTKTQRRKKIMKTTQSKRAGITFPVGRVGRYLRQKKYAPRIGAGAPIYLAAVLEYLCAEVLELAGNIAKEHGRKTINPNFIKMAIQQDDEFKKMMQDCHFPEGSV